MFLLRARKKGRKVRLSFRAGRVIPADEFYSRPYFVKLPEKFHSSGRVACEHIALGRLIKTPNLLDDDGKTMWVGTLPGKVGSGGSAVIHWSPREKTMELVSLWVPNIRRMSGNGGKITDKIIQTAIERGAKTITSSTSNGNDFLPMRKLLEGKGFRPIRAYRYLPTIDYEKKLQ